MALDGGSIKDAEGRLQRFLSLRSVLFGLEKPMLEDSDELKRHTVESPLRTPA